MKKIIAVGDLHIPYQIDLKGFIKFLRDEKPDELILGGDIMDVVALSRWALAGGKRLTLEGKRFQKECDATNKILDEFREAVGKKCKIVYLEGNHENWCEQYIDKNPGMEGLINIPKMLELDKKKIEWVPYRSIKNHYKVGKLYFTHGEYTSKYHAAKMLSAWNCNIRYFHLHSHMVYTRTAKRGVGDFHKAVSIPCMCKEGDYLTGKSHNWENGFYIAHIKPNGNFYENIISIIDNQFYYNGKLY